MDLMDVLQEQSLEFANYESPDFILIKEAMLIYECILNKTLMTSEGEVTFDKASEKDKRYLFQMIFILQKTFGTTDLEWFCAAEAIINTIFNLKSRNAHEYARLLLQQLQNKLSGQTDLHYAQLFFSVGHVAIKMLTFVEQLEADLKMAINKKKKGRDESSQAPSEVEEDLAAITGGNDAEIEAYCQLLQKITEEKLI